MTQQAADSIKGGTALDAAGGTNPLEASVRAARRRHRPGHDAGGNPVRNAEVAVAELVIESDVAAIAEAERERAAATAVQVALGTDARAPVRAQEAEEILAGADERDSRAEIRDRVAEDREKAASLRSFLGDREQEEYEQHAAGLPGRRAAAMDRIDARTDRACAALDRARLSADSSPGSGAVGVSERHMAEVAAELSHDLRVPLSSIMASVEMLEDELSGHCDETVAALLGSATRAGDRMVRMLDQNMTPPTPGGPTALPVVDLAEVVRQVVLDSAGFLEPVGAVVETGELPVVHADPGAMYSVLQNLLTNSVKFARPGVPAWVRISARRSVDGWRVSVRDNGVGLPEDSETDVFSLFYRGTSDVTGHGIGLATVARVVAAHGGRVGVAPVETGAEIWFELPEGDVVR